MPYMFTTGRQATLSGLALTALASRAESFSENAAISADGRFVAFDSLSDNLVSGDTNGYDDVFVHDRQTGDTERVSVNSGGGESDSRSSYAALSADGRFVTFASAAGNLVAGDDNGKDDIFVHDRQTGLTSRVSVDSAGIQANDHSLTEGPRISADGRFVAFDSEATNLVPGDTNGSADVFLHDRQTGDTQRVSVDSAGSQGNALSSAPDINQDGGFVVFGSNASNLITGDTNGMPDVFVRCPEGPCGAGPTPTPPAGQLLGDVNCVGGVNSVDALFVLRSVAQIEPSGDCLAAAGDVNCSGGINAVDSLQILRYVAGMPVSQEPECPGIGTAIPAFAAAP